MIGLDTNVLVRLLVADDADQAARAVVLLDRARAAGEPLYLDPVVLVETAWVLRKNYRALRSDIAEALSSLLGNAAYEIGDRESVEAALALFADGAADFADCLIAIRGAAAGCRHIVTFDADAAKIPGMLAL